MRAILLAAVAALSFASISHAAPGDGGDPPYKLDTKGRCHGKTAFATQSLCAAPAAPAAPAGSTGMCKDKTWTSSKTHSGACSHHGGVDHWL